MVGFAAKLQLFPGCVKRRTLPDATHTSDKMAYRPHLRLQSLRAVSKRCKILTSLTAGLRVENVFFVFF